MFWHFICLDYRSSEAKSMVTPAEYVRKKTDWITSGP